MCYPSPTADMLSRTLENHIITMSVAANFKHSDWSILKLSSADPSEINIVNIRYLWMKDQCFQTLLILHTTKVDCCFPVALEDINSQVITFHFDFKIMHRICKM